MKTLQTGTKVLIEATVLNSTEMYTLAKTRSSEIAVLTSDLTVCETEEVETRTWKVHKSDPDFIKVGEAAQAHSKWKSDDWKNEAEYIFTFDDSFGWNNEETLAKVHRSYPTITGQQALRLLGVETQPSDQSSTPSFKAGQEYQWGKEYEFSADGVNWEKGLFIAKNPRYDDDYLYMSLRTDFILGTKYIRPIPAQPTVESELRQLYEKAKAIDRYETWKSLATARHQKHSGGVEVSVPSDEEILDVYMKTREGSTEKEVIATVRHFMTRKEQQG